MGTEKKISVFKWRLKEGYGRVKRSGENPFQAWHVECNGVSESPINSYELVVYNCTCFDLCTGIWNLELFLSDIP
jgi:hypothetical protein